MSNNSIPSDIYIRDLILIEIKINLSDSNYVELKFSNSQSGKNIEYSTLKMTGIKKFDFYIDNSIYIIEDYKLFFREKELDYYLSLDPDMSTNEIDTNDCGVIISSELAWESRLKPSA